MEEEFSGGLDYYRFNKKNELIVSITSILNQAKNELSNNGWSKEQLMYVVKEFDELINEVENGKLIFKYGKKQRTLDSVYIMTDSLQPLSKTILGDKILCFQEIIRKYK